MSLGLRIRKRRLELGMTQKQLGDLCGVSEATINRYESGVIESPKHDVLIKLLSALKVEPNYLMGWEDLYGQQVKASESQEHYYHDIETRDIADAISKDSELKLLFSAAREKLKIIKFIYFAQNAVL